MERRLAAILVADVAGYSRLMGEDEAGTLRRFKTLETEIVEPTVDRYKGRIVKRMGDGYLVEFSSVVDAVKCATEWQEAVDQTSGDQDIRYRIGINVGDVIVDNGDIYGDGVNVAARLEGLAEPGGICVSGTARDQVSGKVEFVFEPLGVQSLKNIVEPVAVYCLENQPSGKASAKIGSLRVDLALPDCPSIVVLPFQNMSVEPEQEFFADGLTEDIITRVSYLRDLLVISRTSAFAYKARSVRVEDVARDLGVRYVLEGSVRKAGNQVRVTAQLIDSSTGGHLWAQKFDRLLTDIFAIQDEITREIVMAMQVNLTDGEVARMEGGATRNPEAWEAFLKGVLTLLKYTKEDNQNARNMFERALLLDPNYLDAKAYLAWTHWIDARYGHVANRTDALQRSGVLLQEIKDTGDQLADAVHLEACSLIMERRHEEALEAALTAANLGPSKIFGLTPAALILMYCDKPQSTVDLLRTTIRLSPFCPPDAIYYLAYALSWLGHHEDAIRAAEDYGRRIPGDRYAYVLQAVIFNFAGNKERASLAVEKLRELYPTFTIGEFIEHELYRDPDKLDQVVGGLREAGLPE